MEREGPGPALRLYYIEGYLQYTYKRGWGKDKELTMIHIRETFT